MNLFKKSSLRRFVFATLLGFAWISSFSPLSFAQTAEPPAQEEKVEKATPPPPEPPPKPPGEDPDDQPRSQNNSSRKSRRSSHNNDFPFADHRVGPLEYQNDAVSIGGSNLVEGEARTAVAIFGDNTIKGQVRGQVVTIFGHANITGRVRGQVVVVMGDATFGPEAVVDGQVVVVGGTLRKDPSARLHGETRVLPFSLPTNLGGLQNWFHACVLWGRPLAFGPHLAWAWLVAGVFLAFYVVLALLFRPSIEKCVSTFEQRPGMSVVATFFTMAAAPLLLLLLAVTGVGFLLIPLVISALFFTGLFGRAVMCAWLGRRLTSSFGESPLQPVALAVLFGGVLIGFLYAVPFFGFFLWQLLGSLGLGVVFYTIILSTRRAQTMAAVASGGPQLPPPLVVNRETPPVVPAPEPSVSNPVLPLAVVGSALPRAGFWIRLAALAIDVFLVGAISIPLGGPKFTLVLLVIYAASLWQLKATTIGGIVCGLKVVRLDDRPIDWSIAIVRALGCFLSLAVGGLGFIWVAFDPERQSWHDKIAGTTVVHQPKGTSLL